MKIKFVSDVENKKVVFYIKQGELKDWVANAMKEFPELNDEQLCNKGSNFLALVMTRTMQEVCKKNGIKDWEDFKPDFVLYKSNEQLPTFLR